MCTLIIPTYNRPECLSRVLKYSLLSKSITSIIVADSSFTDVKNNNKEIISNLFDNRIIYKDEYNPNINPYVKFTDALSCVESKYVVFCADDDFISLTGIDICIDFLNFNSDYVAAQGTIIEFCIDSKFNLRIYKNRNTEESIDSIDSSIRLYNHLSKYLTPTIYAVHKTDILKKSFSYIMDYTDDGRFGELLPSMVTVIHGKFKIFPFAYSFRESNMISGGQTSEGMSDFIDNGSFSNKYKRFKTCLINELIAKEDISIKHAQSIIDKAMVKYLNTTFFKIHTKLLAKKIFGESKFLKIWIRFYRKFNSGAKQSQQQTLQSIEWNNPEAEYFKDLSLIKEAIVNYKTL